MNAVPLEGAIRVALHLADGRVAAVAVENGRPAAPGRMFVGRRAAEVPGLLPLLFSLCGGAQLVAGLRAVEDAGGVRTAAAQEDARRLLLAAETVIEHATRMLRDWPELVGEASDLAAVKALRAALTPIRGLLWPGREWARPGGGVLAPDVAAVQAHLAEARRVLHEHLFAGPPAAAVVDPEGFAAWTRAARTPAARLAARLSGPLAAFGANDVPPLSLPCPDRLSERLAADADGSFLARPEWHGCERLTHPLARHEGHPLVAELVRRFGNGALSLAAARLVELQQSLQQAEDLAARLQPHPGSTEAPGDGVGLGMVEAARGLLAHRVEIEDGAVARYQILAPTDWNFHPRGALALGVEGAPHTPDLAWRVRLLASLIDPCVDFSAAIIPEAGAHSPAGCGIMPGEAGNGDA